jgi:LacI family transcriptional regulator
MRGLAFKAEAWPNPVRSRLSGRLTGPGHQRTIRTENVSENVYASESEGGRCLPVHDRGSSRPRQPTIRDVARLAGVSVVTVSRVLNDRPDVAVKTRERVRSVIADLRFVPAAAARALPKGGHPAIALLTYEGFATAPFYRSVIEGAMVEATRRGYALIITPVGKDAQSPDLGVDFLISHRAAGVVVARPQPFYTPAFYAAMQRVSVPIITTGNYRDPAERMHALDMDVRTAARDLTRHLIGLGHRTFALLRGYPHVGGADARVAGHREALAEAGIAFDESLVEACEWTLDEGVRAMGALLARERPRFSALVAHHDYVAIGAIQVLAGHGLRVPDDMAVVGFEDDAVSSYLTPALTSVHVPARTIGIAAVGRAITPASECRGAELLACELVVRQSCGAGPHGTGNDTALKRLEDAMI